MGTIWRPRAPERRPIHTVFQSYALFPHMTVAQNVAFPLRMAGRSAAEIQRLTREALDNVHLSDKAAQYPHELSGGQKQRVALARGIVNRPRLLLLDEPLGALDAKLREEMQLELINLQRDVGITFVFVTHAQYEALALSSRIAVMNEGRIEQLDEPSRIYGFPRNRFVAHFIGNINLIEAQIIDADASRLRLRVGKLGEVSAPPVADAKAGRTRIVRPAAGADPHHRAQRCAAVGEPLHRHRARPALCRRCHDLCHRSGRRHPVRGAVAQFHARAREVLRHRRPGGDRVAP